MRCAGTALVTINSQFIIAERRRVDLCCVCVCVDAMPQPVSPRARVLRSMTTWPQCTLGLAFTRRISGTDEGAAAAAARSLSNYPFACSTAPLPLQLCISFIFILFGRLFLVCTAHALPPREPNQERTPKVTCSRVRCAPSRSRCRFLYISRSVRVINLLRCSLFCR